MRAAASRARAYVAALAFLFAAPLAIAADAAKGWETGSDGLAPIPPFSAHVVDVTGTLDAADKQQLESKLGDWEQKSGNQLAVLIVPTIKPEPIEGYSLRVAEAWKVGRKGRDNGALFVIAKDDRKMRIEVGYGLEGVLTDVTSKRIIAETVAPLFRDGKYPAGIQAGVDRIIDVVDKGQPLSERAPPPPAKMRSTGFNFETMLILLFVVVPIVGGILTRLLGRIGGGGVGAGIVGAAAWLVGGSIVIGAIAALVAFIVIIFFGAGTGLGGRGGGLWLPGGGGGFGGGGFGGGGGGGGFGGGGGGSFGGGGASGDW
jgi:uncharacterized protein